MNPLTIIFVLLVIAIGVIVPFTLRSILWNRVQSKVRRKKLDEAMKTVKSRFASLILSDFQRGWAELRIQLLKGNKAEVSAITRRMMRMGLSPHEARFVASATFFYFIDAEDAELSKAMLEWLEDSVSPKEAQYYGLWYRVLIEHQSGDIDAVATLIEEHEGNKDPDDHSLGVLYYLQGLQYHYRGDHAEATKQLLVAKRLLDHTPYESKVRQALKLARERRGKDS